MIKKIIIKEKDLFKKDTTKKINKFLLKLERKFEPLWCIGKVGNKEKILLKESGYLELELSRDLYLEAHLTQKESEFKKALKEIIEKFKQND